MNNIVKYKKISNLCEFFIEQELKNPNKNFLYSKKKMSGLETRILRLKEKFQKLHLFLLKKKYTKMTEFY